MPKDVPQANLVECESYGAHITLVDGLISDCARMIGERKEKEGWFEISTLKEPFRVEGKKTMGYEVAEQMNWPEDCAKERPFEAEAKILGRDRPRVGAPGPAAGTLNGSPDTWDRAG